MHEKVSWTGCHGVNLIESEIVSKSPFTVAFIDAIHDF